MIINVIVLLFFIVSIFYTIKYKFIQLKFIKESKIALKNKKSKSAFLLSLGSHIGAGNILGVTTALIIGGPGVLFWMTVCTIFTSIFSLIENTLGLKYKTVIDDEERGGSPYYILNGLNNKTLSSIFSIILVLSSTIFFLPIQVRGVCYSITSIFKVDLFFVFLFLIIFSLLFIFRGTEILIKCIDKIVPIMTFAFLFVCIFGIISRFRFIDDVIKMIINDAFNFKSGIASVIIIGLKRSIFSNEAGLGTAPSINCYSNNLPIRQGYLQVLTCFIDTIVMCVMFGFVILLYDVDLNGYSGEELSIAIFEKMFNSNGKIIGNFLLFIFSFATIISSFYAGETNMLFNCINKNNRVKLYKFIYKILFTIGIFLGIYLKNNKIWELVDYGLVILGTINLIVILKLQNKFKDEIIV